MPTALSCVASLAVRARLVNPKSTPPLVARFTPASDPVSSIWKTTPGCDSENRFASAFTAAIAPPPPVAV